MTFSYFCLFVYKTVHAGAAFLLFTIKSDFAYGFWPTTSVDLFGDCLPVPHIFKSIFKSALGFSLRQRVLRCRFCSQRPFSLGCEDTSPVVSVVFMRSFYFFLRACLKNVAADVSRRTRREFGAKSADLRRRLRTAYFSDTLLIPIKVRWGSFTQSTIAQFFQCNYSKRRKG